MGARLRSGSWLDVAESCPVHVKMIGSNEANLSIGEVGGGGMSSEHEMSFEFAVFKDMVGQAVQALAEMEAKRSDHS